ncbi:MAG: hypothetical protein ABSA85_13475 [Terracidiphilus sp.]|jgi:photosystem II stability/assembly factor-like uncharacterized protein
MKIWLLAVVLAACGAAHAQWEIESSGTTADLRGVDNVGGGVAWASGTNGTVLRTEDGGYLWQACAVPPGAEHLDFRGVQAFDANAAIVMSSGKGDLSRLYKTTDGCHTWKLVFMNPDADGFWDALMLNRYDSDGFVLGDPVNGRFSFWETSDKGATWTKSNVRGLEALANESAFAASNSSLLVEEAFAIGFVTGGAKEVRTFLMQDDESFKSFRVFSQGVSSSSGAFSISVRDDYGWVVVGGNFLKPNDRYGTASYTRDGGKTWRASQTPPNGYRSAVAYDAASKTWITVGPNGTDISTDDGKNWRALHPDPAMHEAADADRDWNALSLPFVVGPHGRIGKLNPKALTH